MRLFIIVGVLVGLGACSSGGRLGCPDQQLPCGDECRPAGATCSGVDAGHGDAASSAALLQALRGSPGSLSPAFDLATTLYKVA